MRPESEAWAHPMLSRGSRSPVRPSGRWILWKPRRARSARLLPPAKREDGGSGQSGQAVGEKAASAAGNGFRHGHSNIEAIRSTSAWVSPGLFA